MTTELEKQLAEALSLSVVVLSAELMTKQSLIDALQAGHDALKEYNRQLNQENNRVHY
jgi:hypothetical protein